MRKQRLRSAGRAVSSADVQVVEYGNPAHMAGITAHLRTLFTTARAETNPQATTFKNELLEIANMLTPHTLEQEAHAINRLSGR